MTYQCHSYTYTQEIKVHAHTKKLYMNIYTSKIHNRQNVDTNVHQFMNGLTNVPYPYNAIWFGHKKELEWSSDTSLL